MYETIRIVNKIKPKYVIWENVKNLLSKNHKHNFDAYLQTMEQLGYTNYYQVLNAKDYGIPQNRERVFTISILNGQDFKFPLKQELQLRLKDLLEDTVDEKYYLQAGSIYDKEGLSPTLDTMEGGWRQPSIIEDKLPGAYGRDFGSKGKIQRDICSTLQAAMGSGGGNVPLVKDGFVEQKYEEFIKENGYVPELFNPYNKTQIGDIAPTQTTCCNSTTSSATVLKLDTDNLRIRKLTPKECWRLMGFSDTAFEKAEKVNSNTQLYKQAGNSIVVNVLTEIFKKLFAH